MQTIRVICVDDHPDVLSAMKSLICGQADMRCERTFEDADSVLEYLEQTPAADQPDVILLDWAMPGLSPCEALRRISERWVDIRVLVFSAHPRHIVEPEAVAAGAWAYLSKSMDIREVLEAIRTAARGEPVLQ